MTIYSNPDHPPLVNEFVRRVDRFDERFKGKDWAYVKNDLMPIEVLRAVRDHLKGIEAPAMQPALFEQEI